MPDGLPTLMRAQIAAEMELYKPQWNTGNPPAPGLYFANIHLHHDGRIVGKTRRLEEWNGERWPFIGPSDHKNFGGKVVGWYAVPEVI